MGKEDVIKSSIEGYDYDKDRIIIVNAEDTISNNDTPVMAIRRKGIPQSLLH